MASHLTPGTCDVDGVTLLLVQEMVYTCNLGEGDDERQKKEVLVVSDDSDSSDADPGETKVYDKLKLKVSRNLPVSGYPHCEYIDCGYFVHAVAKTASTFDDIVVKLPVMIIAGDKEDWELDNSDPFEAAVGLLVIYLVKLSEPHIEIFRLKRMTRGKRQKP